MKKISIFYSVILVCLFVSVINVNSVNAGATYKKFPPPNETQWVLSHLWNGSLAEYININTLKIEKAGSNYYDASIVNYYVDYLRDKQMHEITKTETLYFRFYDNGLVQIYNFKNKQFEKIHDESITTIHGPFSSYSEERIASGTILWYVNTEPYKSKFSKILFEKGYHR